MRTIQVCAGIGDSIWLLMKLINTGEKFHFELPDGKPQRGHQIFELLPQIAESVTYVPGLSYKTLAKKNIQNKKKRWELINDQKFCLSCNEHLENGHRIEGFLPDLPTSYLLDYKTEEYAEHVDLEFKGKYIGIYCSAYSTTRAWGFWSELEWFKLISMIHTIDDSYIFVIIGAEWDIDIATNLVGLLEQHGIPYKQVISRPLGEVAEIMKRLTYAFYFPSGLAILSETLGLPTFMFYPPHLQQMIESWAHPDRIQGGQYKGALFCTPEKAFDWAFENEKI